MCGEAGCFSALFWSMRSTSMLFLGGVTKIASSPSELCMTGTLAVRWAQRILVLAVVVCIHALHLHAVVHQPRLFGAVLVGDLHTEAARGCSALGKSASECTKHVTQPVTQPRRVKSDLSVVAGNNSRTSLSDGMSCTGISGIIFLLSKWNLFVDTGSFSTEEIHVVVGPAFEQLQDVSRDLRTLSELLNETLKAALLRHLHSLKILLLKLLNPDLLLLLLLLGHLIAAALLAVPRQDLYRRQHTTGPWLLVASTGVEAINNKDSAWLPMLRPCSSAFASACC